MLHQVPSGDAKGTSSQPEQLKVPSSFMPQVQSTPALGMFTVPWLQGLPKN